MKRLPLTKKPEVRQRLIEIRKREAATTPGRWKNAGVNRDSVTASVALDELAERKIIVVSQHECGKQREMIANAVFIANSKADVPWLLELITSLELEIEKRDTAINIFERLRSKSNK